MNELKPCPFCGGNRIMFRIEGYFKPWENKGLSLWYHCACYDCGAEMNVGGNKDSDKAAEEWNERAGELSD